MCSFLASTGGCRLIRWTAIRALPTRLASVWDMCFDAGERMRRNVKIAKWFVFLLACAHGTQVGAQEKSVTMNVVIGSTETASFKSPANKIPDASNVAVWLTPLDRADADSHVQEPEEKRPQ